MHLATGDGEGSFLEQENPGMMGKKRKHGKREREKEKR